MPMGTGSVMSSHSRHHMKNATQISHMVVDVIARSPAQ